MPCNQCFTHITLVKLQLDDVIGMLMALYSKGSDFNPSPKGEKDFNDDLKEEITGFVQSIPGFQECDEDVETWMACDSKDCGFQMLNDDEIVISVRNESNPVDDETDENEDNNNESSKSPSNADAFSALETAMEWNEQQSVMSYSTTVAQENQTLQRKISDYFPQ
ncbi:uncharacterized protein TNCV_3280841 [Trichonephila clavipes]|nr:uncharacterized protein TNCV_3280841 [Trichonephila clavipes]